MPFLPTCADISNMTCLIARLAVLEDQVNGNQSSLLDEAFGGISRHADALDTAWVLTCGMLVFLMQLGFAMLEAGFVREHSVIATYMKNLLDLNLGTLTGACFGYYLAYERHPLSIRVEDPSYDHRSFFFYTAFQSTAATIVSGAMAERTSITGYAFISVLMSGFVYAFAVRLTWAGGWLAQQNYHDFAGSGVVHLVGGAAALAGAITVGPRRGRWDPQNAATFVPHSVPSVLSGTLVLWVGWYGFNAGSTHAMSTDAHAQAASNAVITTTLSACAGGLSAATISFLKSPRHGHVLHDILALSNGILAGLVSITAGCDVVDAKSSMLVGLIGALAAEGGVQLRTRLRIDDIVDAFAVHCCAGAWGVLAVGLWHHQKGLFTGGGASLLGSQALGVLLLGLIGFVPIGLLTCALGKAGWLRVSAEEETKGIDHLFGMKAYAQTDEVLQHLTAIDGILRSYGYDGSLVQALESIDTHAACMQQQRVARGSRATSRKQRLSSLLRNRSSRADSNAPRSAANSDSMPNSDMSALASPETSGCHEPGTPTRKAIDCAVRLSSKRATKPPPGAWPSKSVKFDEARAPQSSRSPFASLSSGAARLSSESTDGGDARQRGGSGPSHDATPGVLTASAGGAAAPRHCVSESPSRRSELLSCGREVEKPPRTLATIASVADCSALPASSAGASPLSSPMPLVCMDSQSFSSQI